MSPRYAAKVDANQGEIVHYLRGVGATVLSLARLGEDAPDLLVGWRGVDYLLEVKQPGEQPTDGQRHWHRTWNGRAVRVVTSPAEALQAIGAIAGGAVPAATRRERSER